MTLTMAPAGVGDLDDGPDVRLDVGVAAGLEGADLEDHVELGRAVAERRTASKTFVSVRWLPCGKPMVVPTATSVPSRIARARTTSAGRTQTEATSYAAASRQPASTKASSSSGRSSEWSIVLATSR